MDKNTIVNADIIMGLRPCGRWPRERVEKFVKGDISALEFLRIKEILPEDRAWVVAKLKKDDGRDDKLVLRFASIAFSRLRKVADNGFEEAILKALACEAEGLLRLSLDGINIDEKMRGFLQAAKIIDSTKLLTVHAQFIVTGSLYHALAMPYPDDMLNGIVDAYAEALEMQE